MIKPLTTLLLALLALPAYGQDFAGMRFLDPEDAERPDSTPGEPEFMMVRAIYDNYTDSGYGFYRGPQGGWWQTDYEESDRNFLRGLQRYTTLDTNSFAFKALSITDPELFRHAFLYINMKRLPLSGGNGPNFTPEEAQALRQYMLKGGFVLLDDFWGEEHWQDFLVELAKIFPDRPLQRLDTSHPIFHTFFDIDAVPQVPGRAVTWNYGEGFYLNDPEFPPAVHAVLDDEGRVMLVANFNSDMGDGWEHTFYEAYPTEFCNEAYKLGINFVVYAMSH